MQKHRISVKWSDAGKGLLTQGKNILVETISVCGNGLHILAHSKAILNAQVELRENPKEHTYKVEPNSFLSDQYPNIVVIPSNHILPKWMTTIVPFVLVNQSVESSLSK